MSLMPVDVDSRTLRAAGMASITADEKTEYCLKFGERPPTPDRDRKWRTVQEPGARIRHPGLRNDAVDDTQVFGDFVAGSEHVPDVMSHGGSKPLDAYMQSRGEAIYRSTKREPLGKPYERGHVIPDRMKASDYRFGITSDTSEAAKNLLFPPDDEERMEDVERYKKSHAAYGPGEQRTRGYTWGKIDPATHSFGGRKPLEEEKEGVAIALNPERNVEAPPSRVVPKKVAEARNFTADHLGRVKNLGRGPPASAPDRFGIPPRGDTEWGAADCLRGDFDVEEQMPDKDLGRSTRPGYRNVSKDPERVFGVPSIRRDIPKRTNTSVTDASNYGDGPCAQDLLAPSRFSEIGVGHEDFVEARAAEEIREIFSSCGYTLDDTEFRNVYRRAATHYDLNRNGVVSVEEFRLALNEYQDALEEGGPPGWFEDAE